MPNVKIKLLGFLGLGVAALGLRGSFRRYAIARLTAPDRFLSSETPADYGMPFEEVILKTRDNLKIYGWYIPAENSKATIIVAHGYSGCRASDLRHAHWLWEAGYNVMLQDFRGHGCSDGPCGTSVGYMERLDIHAAVDYLLGKGERRIGLFGISMGASAAIIVAGENPYIGAVVADSPFAYLYRSISTEIDRIYHLPRSIAIPLAKYVYKSVAAYHGFDVKVSHPMHYINRISPRPLLLIHGENDTLTQVENSKILYELAGEPKDLWIIPGMEHTQGFDFYPDEYKNHILDFFGRVDWQSKMRNELQELWGGKVLVETLDRR